MTPEKIRLDDRLFYWKATEDPLSADVGVFEGRDGFWVFDVGSSPEAAACIQSLPGPKYVVLSHFHPDHTANLSKIAFDVLYQGRFTFRRTNVGEVVEAVCTPEAGVRLFPLPSSHAKGCLGMEIGGKYAFLGDGTYCAMREGRPAYNVSLLAELLRTLRSLDAPWFLLSHDSAFVRKKEEVLAELEEIYARRDPKSAYIFVG